MRAQCVFMLAVYMFTVCYADIIYTPTGVIDSNPYVGTSKLKVDQVHSRQKRNTDDGWVNSVYTSDQKQAIADKHNELRSGVDPEAANMQYMVWDEDLATIAQTWSEKCIWDHGQPDNYTTLTDFATLGQNLWLGGGTANDPTPNGIGATQAWYNEVSQYTFETRACSGVCGHYTQVVWDDSYAVGCGVNFCSETVEGGEEGPSNAWLITCNYGNPGNYPRQPYIAGSPCTKCASGSGQCYNNTCRPCSDHDEECVCRQQCHNCGTLNTTTCRCSCFVGYTGVDCSDVCENTSTYCGAGWYTAQCHIDYVMEGCHLMCGLCDGPSSDNVCDANIATTAGHQQSSTTSASKTADPDVCPVPCHNGGTIDDACDCVCESGYQGNLCEEIIEQVENGVVIDIETPLSDWDDLREDFLTAIEVAVEDHCNIDENYATCCPNSGDKNSDGDLNFLGSEDVQVADGYPQSNDPSVSFFVMIYVTPKEDNELCADASSTDVRKRREIMLIFQRVKRDVTVYLDQDVFLAIVVANEGNISHACGVPLGEIKKGNVTIIEEEVEEEEKEEEVEEEEKEEEVEEEEKEEEDEEDDDDGKNGALVIGIIAGVIVLIVIVIVAIVCITKNNKKGRIGSAEPLPET